MTSERSRCKEIRRWIEKWSCAKKIHNRGFGVYSDNVLGPAIRGTGYLPIGHVPNLMKTTFKSSETASCVFALNDNASDMRHVSWKCIWRHPAIEPLVCWPYKVQPKNNS